MRCAGNVDGDGHPAYDANDEYWAAFANALADLGCPADGCSGYELVANLDFDTNGSGQADEGDNYWNDGLGWIPMRSKWSVGDGDIVVGYSNTSQLSSTFDGNGHTIAILWGRALILENFGTISNLVLTGNVDGQYGSWHCGVLVCSNDSDGIISGVTVIGNVNGPGGLVGENGRHHPRQHGQSSCGGRHDSRRLGGKSTSAISATASPVAIVESPNYNYNAADNSGIGGLVGINDGTINDSTASGEVSVPPTMRGE